jgi:hypothetical protein
MKTRLRFWICNAVSEEAQTMKRTARTALRVATGVAVIGVCAALLAGKDDIRKFRRMYSM